MILSLSSGANIGGFREAITTHDGSVGLWDWKIYLHEWLIFVVSVCKHISHMDLMGSI